MGLAPGVAFGAGGEGSIRICYAAEQAILEPAMERLAGFLVKHQQRQQRCLVTDKTSPVLNHR